MREALERHRVAVPHQVTDRLGEGNDRGGGGWGCGHVRFAYFRAQSEHDKRQPPTASTGVVRREMSARRTGGRLTDGSVCGSIGIRADRRPRPQQRPVPPRARHPGDGESGGSGGLRLALGQRSHRPARDDRVALPVRRGRPRDLGDRHPVRGRADRAGPDGGGDRASHPRHRGARAPAPQPGGLRQAGRLDRHRERRPAPARRRCRLARGGVRCAQRPLREARRPARRVDGDRPRLLDGPAAGPPERALHAAGGHALPACARCPDPLPDGRPLARGAEARRHARRRLARAAVAGRARPGARSPRRRPR